MIKLGIFWWEFLKVAIKFDSSGLNGLTPCLIMEMANILFWQGYIQYMKFARRAEGIKSARMIFKMAREDSRTKYQVFVAAALMEYYCSKVITLPYNFMKACQISFVLTI